MRNPTKIGLNHTKQPNSAISCCEDAKIPAFIFPHFKIASERTGMDKTTGESCPRCGQLTLNVYYEDGTDLQLGAKCDSCGLKGFYMNGKLVPLVEA